VEPHPAGAERSVHLAHADIVAFAADTDELMATLVTFEWVSVSAKMHMLHRHASPFMTQ